ncbi:ester cyclase [Vibrio sp. SCSIO 43136]|uniref:nuclear transport factor 2 family protein n=1 Tax=Vibrio sp. SCSIO 43136 TaxID=2819101 RepID=UPI002074E56C|nr:ester cyclase [Vibrio sp. SCSIO 43136]USD67424.1 nuclear transport factor 2 family protein [Vibrio sp. SCSIO 43136]
MEKPTINLEQFKRDSWSDTETQNAEKIVDLVQNLMNTHDYDYVEKTFAQSTYKQHNRGIPDTLNGLLGYLRNFTKQFPEFSYSVKNIYVDGDYVTLHSHATLKKAHRGNDKKGMNIVDTWKISGNNIEAHWDAVQPLDWFMRLYTFLTGGAIRNSNGPF